MEEIEDHRHIKTRERLCDTQKLPSNIPSVPHVQTLRTLLINLNRIAPTIEKHLIKEQTGIRPGKSSTNQWLSIMYSHQPYSTSTTTNNMLRNSPLHLARGRLGSHTVYQVWLVSSLPIDIINCYCPYVLLSPVLNYNIKCKFIKYRNDVDDLCTCIINICFMPTRELHSRL